MAGFLQGYQQAKAAKEAQSRQTGLDAQQQQRYQSEEQYRNAQIEEQRQGHRLDFMKQFQGSLDSFDNPSQIDAYINMVTPTAKGFGVDSGALNALRPAPTTLQKKAAEKKLTALKSQYGEKWMQMGGQFVHDLSNGEKAVPFAKVLEYAGMTPDASAPPLPGPNTDKRGFATKDVTVNGKRILAAFDPDTNQYYAPGDTKTPLAGDIQEYTKPTTSADGLTPRQTQQVSAQARTYDTNQVVKNTQVMSEAVSFASGLDSNTKNPADDQALIYAFAKAMDPNSVVREGEYATVQKYAQSWAESFGFNAQRIFSNTAFLTPQARQNMKKTIQSRFRAAQGQYKVVRESYVKKINKITGMQDGEDWLTDYGAAFPTDATPNTNGTGRATVTPPTSAPTAAPAGAVPNPFRR